ncbi:hypothetical protein PCANC_24187 [Puccinia coronata f. sp. avenae]|uniref:Uncharacterized protein n=1 Tax=Puccinia coronata f. sp. avenae TaxID=200324 RepID=A0A2N5S8G1_9BASI|nr:hypothetical protein PCANC_24187 [Puccinia coronata f. sp. avenae]PLW50523.1 hypothetical protein PCASD_01435 [Puccinia coronata f. sp. avenae]
MKLTLEIRNPHQLLKIYSNAPGATILNLEILSPDTCVIFLGHYYPGTALDNIQSLTPQQKPNSTHCWTRQLISIDNQELNERLFMEDEEFKQKFSNTHYIDNKGLDEKLKRFGSNPKKGHIDLKTKGLPQELQNHQFTT